MKRRIFSLIVSVIILVGALPLNSITAFAKSDVIDSGVLSTGLEWSLDINGCLTISGEGQMPHFGKYQAPWFDYVSDIESAVIEQGVNNIGSYAFYYCDEMESVVIPEGVNNIGNGSFENCFSLKEVVFPDSLSSTATSSFEDCEDLESVTFGENFEYVGQYSFNGCVSLKNLALPQKTTAVAASAFYGCENLQTVTMSDNVTLIGDYAFQNCYSLTSVRLSEQLQSIGTNAFLCTGLKEVFIPESVITVKDYAFGYCESLSSVYCGAASKPFGWNYYWLSNTNAEVFWESNGIPKYKDDLRYGWHVLEQMDNSKSLLYAYEKLVAGIAEMEESISVSGNGCEVSVQEITDVMKIVLGDFPEYFWAANGFRYSYNPETNSVLTVLVNYSIDKSELESAVAAVESAANELLKDLNGKSEYDKALVIHDRLAKKIAYQFSENDQTIYGALVENKAVCAGYASAYQYLLHKAGITAWRVTGSSINPSTGTAEPHAWNMVYLDDDWYHTDVTWADQGDDIYHAYFNVTTDEIKEDHVMESIYEDYAPVCNADKDNFFTKNGGKKDRFDTDSIAEDFKKGHMHIDYYIVGNIAQFLNDFSDHILEIAQKLGITDTFSYSYRRLGRELRIDIQVLHECVYDKMIVDDYYLISEGTCSTPATYWYSCSCGKIGATAFEGIVNPDKHIGDTELRNKTEATCSYNGYTGDIHCAACGMMLEEGSVIPLSEHSYSVTVFAPDCENDGYTLYVCTSCGDEYISDKVESIGHIFGEWYVFDNGDCYKSGEKHRDCENCDFYEIEIIETTGHNYIPYVTEPTCTEDGFTTYVCNKCGDDFVSDFVDASGHFYAPWWQTKEPTCGVEGEELTECFHCGDSKTRPVAALEHTFCEWYVYKEATCLEDGEERRDCSICGGYEISIVSNGDHAYGNWIVTKEPTCAEKGERTRQCGVCGNIQNTIMSNLGHSYEDIIIEPTCTEDGYTEHICANCDKSYKDTFVEAKGHTEGEWITEVEPDIGKEGWERLYCAECKTLLKENELAPLKPDDPIDPPYVDPGNPPSDGPDYTLGDATGDSVINQYDYILVKRTCMGTMDLDENALVAADVNSDGMVNQYDYVFIKRHCMGTFDLSSMIN